MLKKGYHVILTDEYNTTKLCSECNKELMKPTGPIVKKYLRKNTYEYSCKDTRNVRCIKHY